MRLRDLYRDFQQMPKYFIAAAAVFIVGFILGIDGSDQYSDFINRQLQGLEQIVGSIRDKQHPQLWLFIYIFWNNFSKSLMFIYFGLFFGLLPISVLIVNGMILGYLSAQQAESHSWFFVLKGVLPHGIIEIPAVLIACAYGIRLGFIVLKSMGAILIPGWGTRMRAELTRVIKLTVPLIGVLTAALLVAAIIESTITVWLVHM